MNNNLYLCVPDILDIVKENKMFGRKGTKGGNLVRKNSKLIFLCDVLFLLFVNKIALRNKFGHKINSLKTLLRVINSIFYWKLLLVIIFFMYNTVLYTVQ